MIELSLSEAFLSYLFISMGMVILLWGLMEQRTRSSSSQVEVERSMSCSICLHTYLYDKNESISRCPVCQSFNDTPQ